MKRKLITIQFVQEGLIILSNDKISKYKLKSVDNFQVINKETFTEEFTQIIENLNINNGFLTDNIRIIIDSNYTDLYINNIKEIFQELSFNKIEFTHIQDLINIKDNEILVNISTKSIKIIYKGVIIQSNIYYSKHKQILGIYLKKILKNHNIQFIYLYGDYPYNQRFIEDIEKICKTKTYVYTNPELIPIRFLI